MDDAQNLIPTKDLRVLFDFYLANLDTEPLPRALQRIRAALGQRLVEPALGQSLALLERYVSYRLALDEMDRQLPPGVTADGFDLTALRQRQQALEALRLSQFSPEENSAFFDDEQRLDNYTLARLEIERSETLSSEDKQQQLTSLEQQLPEAQRQARKRATVNGEIYARAEALKAEDASKEKLYQVRANALGAVAAANLAQLDEQQQQWQARLNQYAQARARITEAGLSPSDRDAEVEALRERLFSGREQVRVRALEVDGL
ncbi:MAG: lipase chaperone [Marinobacter sp.]|nr:lipase chaperone [Marinobacter sp.]